MDSGPRSAQTSTLLDQLFAGYQVEGIAMPYTLDDFRRDYILEHFPELTPEQRRKALRWKRVAGVLAKRSSSL